MEWKMGKMKVKMMKKNTDEYVKNWTVDDKGFVFFIGILYHIPSFIISVLLFFKTFSNLTCAFIFLKSY